MFYKTNVNLEGRANRENDSVVSSTHTAPLLYLNLISLLVCEDVASFTFYCAFHKKTYLTLLKINGILIKRLIPPIIMDDRSVGSIRLFLMIDHQILANSQHYLLVLIQLIMFLAEEHLSTGVLPL